MSDAGETPRWVEIEFDCLPLRSIERLDVPMDASPRFQQLCEDIKSAMDRHGSHNTFFLYNARCTFHLTNDADLGAIEFRFQGTVFTDANDKKAVRADLQIQLTRETCEWATESVLHWFEQSVPKAVQAEFDRYIAAGDLDQARERIEKIQAASDDAGGFLGMYL